VEDHTSVESNERQQVFGWCMYDWANSAYATTVLAGVLPAYFADAVVGPDGVDLWGTHYEASTLWAAAVAVAAALAFLCAPVLGAIADFTAAKKRLLLSFAYGGTLFTALLYFCGSGDVVLTLLLFIGAQVGFVGANVFYDAFLPQLVSEDQLDRVSGRGYAYGYLGGGLQFALALGLIAGHEQLGLSQSMAGRVAIAMTAVWWAGFTLFTAVLLKEKPSVETLPSQYARWPRLLAVAAVGIRRTLATSVQVSRYKHLVLFLVAFMLYNDGIQTVIVMATIFGKEELQLSTTFLMLTLLAIQGVAMVGAVVFSRMAEMVGTKRAVMLTLVLWSGVVIYAYFIQTRAEYLTLGVVVGLVLGGSQALSRSFYSSMIPAESSAEFFGFYTVFSKFSAIWGPFVFAVISQLTGSVRLSIVSIIAFFLLGLLLLAFVDPAKAKSMTN
jgi:UMF1 family MFS transporter